MARGEPGTSSRGAWRVSRSSASSGSAAVDMGRCPRQPLTCRTPACAEDPGNAKLRVHDLPDTGQCGLPYGVAGWRVTRGLSRHHTVMSEVARDGRDEHRSLMAELCASDTIRCDEPSADRFDRVWLANSGLPRPETEGKPSEHRARTGARISADAAVARNFCPTGSRNGTGIWGAVEHDRTSTGPRGNQNASRVSIRTTA